MGFKIIQVIPRCEPSFLRSWHLYTCLRTCSTMSQAEYHLVLLQKSGGRGHELYIAAADDLDTDTRGRPRGSVCRALRYGQQAAPKLNRWILVIQRICSS